MFLSSARWQLGLAYATTLTFSLVQMVLYTTIPSIHEKSQVSMPSILAAISVGSLCFAIFTPIWAKLSDRIGRKRVLLIATLGLALSFSLLSSLFIFEPNANVELKTGFVYLSRIAYGVLVSGLVPVSQAWQLDLIPSLDRIKVLTRNSICLNIGRVIAPLLVLYKQVNLEILIFAAAVWSATLTLVYVLVLLIAKKESLSMTIEKSIVHPFEEIKSLFQSMRNSASPLFLALAFTAFVGIIHTFLGAHLKLTFGMNGDTASVYMAKMILLLSVSAIFIQQSSLWISKTNWQLRLVIGSIGMIAGAVTLKLADALWLIPVAVVFISLGTAMIPPVYLKLASDTAQKNRYGEKVGLASVSHSLGYAIGTALIAASLKLHWISEMTAIILVSVAIAGICLHLIGKRSTPVLNEAVT